VEIPRRRLNKRVTRVSSETDVPPAVMFVLTVDGGFYDATGSPPSAAPCEIVRCRVERIVVVQDTVSQIVVSPNRSADRLVASDVTSTFACTRLPAYHRWRTEYGRFAQEIVFSEHVNKLNRPSRETENPRLMASAENNCPVWHLIRRVIRPVFFESVAVT